MRMPTHAVAALLCVAACVLATGCLGSSGSSARPSSSAASPETLSSGAPKPTLLVTYPIRLAQRSAVSAAGDCLKGAICAVRRVHGVTPPMWQLVATRTLSCSPPQGDYASPAGACRALRSYRSLLAEKHEACYCAPVVTIDPTVVGQLDGRHIDFMMDGCTTCGMKAAAFHDTKTLMPLR